MVRLSFLLLNSSVGIAAVQAGHDLDFAAFRMNGIVELEAACQQRGVIMIAGIQASRGDTQMPQWAGMLYQSVFALFYLPCGVVNLSGIDEATAHHQSRRIGHDNVGFLSTDFYHPLQLAGGGTVGLVDNQLCFPACHIGIAIYLAANMGHATRPAIVEDGALAVHIKLLIVVHGYALAIRRGNVHQRQAIIGAQYRDALSRLLVNVALGVQYSWEYAAG